MKRKFSLTKMVILGLLALGLVLIISISAATFFNYKMATMDRYSKFVFSYTKVAADYIDGDVIREYEKTGKIDETYYNEVLKYLNTVIEKAELTYFYVYIPHEDQIEYIWDGENSESQAVLGAMDDYSENGYESTKKIFKKDPPEEISILNDRYGYVATALTPVFDSKGEPVAVVGADVMIHNLKEEIFRGVLYLSLIVIVSMIVFIGIYYWGNKKLVIEPIQKLNTVTSELVEKLDMEEEIHIDINTADEIESLARSFEHMHEELRAYISENNAITAEKERIETELSWATKIQANMLPSIFPAFPGRNEFDVYASMDPAKEVGGDFYDFFLIDEEHLGLVIADVSGKGVPAALFMMMAKILISIYAQEGLSPSETLAHANKAICGHNDENLFVTVWLGIMDISTGKIVASNAGHEYPIIKKKNGEFEMLQDKHCFVVGAMEEIKYKEYDFTLEKGGSLFLYTDGVPEATDNDKELFGVERMLNALNSEPEAAPEQILKNVRVSVDKFVGDAPQFDDITMLCIKLL
ncbi:MAG: SpoIIE family protein phosphatase [Lachnospiraceae bacterium]|nr:SpoIIE family protein phosphatase [Lachnospiraceae bacterium]